MGAFRDLTLENPFGRLTVLERGPSSHGRTRWWCICTCGTKTLVYAGNLTQGFTQSCGCWSEEAKVQNNTTHGLIDTPEYQSWRNMKRRCLDPTNKEFLSYNGRGITICPRWLDSFENFYADLGPKPGPEFSLGRINNDGPYSPENTRWETPTQQARNTRNNRLISINGETACLTEWLQRRGMWFATFQYRIKNGMTDEEALFTPTHHNKPHRRKRNSRSHRLITFQGRTQCIADWAHEKNLIYPTLRTRLNQGWSIEKALTTPVQPRRKRHA